MKAYLVMNKTSGADSSYKDQYQVFVDRTEAIKHFISIGYPAGDTIASSLGISDKIGVMTVYYSDVKVEFMPIEINTQSEKPVCPVCLSSDDMINRGKYEPDWICHATHVL